MLVDPAWKMDILENSFLGSGALWPGRIARTNCAESKECRLNAIVKGELDAPRNEVPRRTFRTFYDRFTPFCGRLIHHATDSKDFPRTKYSTVPIERNLDQNKWYREKD